MYSAEALKDLPSSEKSSRKNESHGGKKSILGFTDICEKNNANSFLHLKTHFCSSPATHCALHVCVKAHVSLYVCYVWYPVWVCGSSCLCAHVCVQESSLFVALSVVRIRVMRVMMCEAVVFCARATLRLTPHSQPNVFLILFIPHHQSTSSDSTCVYAQTHIYYILYLNLHSEHAHTPHLTHSHI